MGLIYRAFLPPVQSVDVTTRLIKYKVNEEYEMLEASVNDAYIDLPPVKDGAVCQLSIKDIDDSGNESEWSSGITFTAKDTIVPGTPEGLSVKLNREVADKLPDSVPIQKPEVPPVVDSTPDETLVDTPEV